MDFSKQTFRCSSLGKLMTKPKNKKDKLSETAKTYLREVFIKEMFDREKEISNKYLEKGIYVEEESLTLVSNKLDKLLIKNQQELSNEYIKGTPDVISNVIIDIKSSWDIYTFFKADGKNFDYYCQLQGYMWLTGLTAAQLAYCLTSAPEHLIVDEKRRAMYSSGLDESMLEWTEIEDKIDKNMRFDDIDSNKRVKIFDFEYSEEFIGSLIEKVHYGRDYLNLLSF